MSDNRNMTDAELDALFKNAENATPVPAFDDAFWGEMEAMLPEKKRVGAFFWWASSAALVAGIAVLVTIYGFNNETDKENSIAKTTRTNHQKATDNASTPRNKEFNNLNEAETTSPIANVNSAEKNTKVNNVHVNPLIEVEDPVLVNEDKSLDELNPTVAESKEPIFVDDQIQLGKRIGFYTAPFVLNDIAVDRKLSSGLPLYTEFSIGFGQSYKRIEFSNNWATQFRLAAGLTKEVPGMQLSVGLALRAEMPNNLSSIKSELYGSETKSTVNDYRGLYSLEFPLEAAGKFGRNALGLFMVPGIQLGYTGNSSYYQNDVLMNRERTSGNLSNAKTMTMECGLKYSYDLSEHLQFTGSCTFDMVRPFQSTYYQGENQDYPVTFFLGLRRKF